jgi:ribosomal protein S18 acetylase RimI-like enzyme
MPILEHNSTFALRQATASDHADLCRVCLLTGASGADATGIEDDSDLIGLVYAVPYQVACPGLAFVIEDAAGICGYLFGTLDTVSFDGFMRDQWYPDLAARVPDAPADSDAWTGSDWLRHRVHHPPPLPSLDLDRYPAHGHIDLLERARGQGVGRWAMGVLISKLSAAGAPGMFLEVSSSNLSAQAFYSRLGFRMPEKPGPDRDAVYMIRDFQ